MGLQKESQGSMRKVSLSQKAMENQTELVCQQQGKGIR